MSYGFPTQPLNAPDAYSDAATIYFPQCARLDMQVTANACYYQIQFSQGYGSAPDTGLWLPEKYVFGLANAITFISLDRRFTGLRVRNATIGQVSQIVAECLTEYELGTSQSGQGRLSA